MGRQTTKPVHKDMQCDCSDPGPRCTPQGICSPTFERDHEQDECRNSKDVDCERHGQAAAALERRPGEWDVGFEKEEDIDQQHCATCSIDCLHHEAATVPAASRQCQHDESDHAAAGAENKELRGRHNTLGAQSCQTKDPSGAEICRQ